MAELMKGQIWASPQRGLPVDPTKDAYSLTTVSGETGQFYYSNSGVRTADAGQAIGTAVECKLAYDNILNSSGSMLATKLDKSLSFTSTAFTTEVTFESLGITQQQFEATDAMTFAMRLSTLTSGMSNGQYVVDYRNGMLYGKKASTQTTLASVGYTVAATSIVASSTITSVIPGTGATNLGKAEDAAHSSGDVGVEVLEVRRDTCVSSAGADGDYATKNQDAEGYSYTRDKAYDTASAAEKASLIRDVSDQYVNETLIDTTNVGAATNYYPSSAGLAMDGYSSISIQGMTSGGVTTTIEATNDDAASPDWVDITKSFIDMITAVAGGASFVDVNFLLSLANKDVLNVKAIRIKSVTSDATNAVQYNIRRIY